MPPFASRVGSTQAIKIALSHSDPLASSSAGQQAREVEVDRARAKYLLFSLSLLSLLHVTSSDRVKFLLPIEETRLPPLGGLPFPPLPFPFPPPAAFRLGRDLRLAITAPTASCGAAAGAVAGGVAEPLLFPSVPLPPCSAAAAAAAAASAAARRFLVQSVSPAITETRVMPATTSRTMNPALPPPDGPVGSSGGLTGGPGSSGGGVGSSSSGAGGAFVDLACCTGGLSGGG